MAFEDEIAQCLTDCQGTFGRAVTLRRVQPGPIDPETGERFEATTDYTGTAIVSERIVDARGATQTVEVQYHVQLGALTPALDSTVLPGPGWRIVDAGVTREICRAERSVQDLAMVLTCRDVRKA